MNIYVKRQADSMLSEMNICVKRQADSMLSEMNIYVKRQADIGLSENKKFWTFQWYVTRKPFY